MKTIGKHQFPETIDEANKWNRTVSYYSLAPQVLVVATTRIEGTWSAYIDAAPGIA